MRIEDSSKGERVLREWKCHNFIDLSLHFGDTNITIKMEKSIQRNSKQNSCLNVSISSPPPRLFSLLPRYVGFPESAVGVVVSP